MTRADQIFILQQELQQAVHLVDFLHNCLQDPELYNYAYPQHTKEKLDSWEKILPTYISCPHSATVEGCPGCADRHYRQRRLVAIRGGKDTAFEPSDEDLNAFLGAVQFMVDNPTSKEARAQVKLGLNHMAQLKGKVDETLKNFWARDYIHGPGGSETPGEDRHEHHSTEL